MNAILKSIVVLFAFAVVAVLAYSTAPAAADFDRYTRVVDYAFVAPYAAIPVRHDVAIIDSRPQKRRYDTGHIPGAVSLPFSQFDKLVDRLPADKGMLVIFYCGGEKCPLSHKSAFKAEKLGYTNVAVYSAGYPDWLAQGRFGSVAAAYVKKVLDRKKAVVVDARPTKRKYAKGHVPGAISIPDRQFGKLSHLLPVDKKIPLIFYCGGLKCPLSVKSAIKARALGYSDVMVFQGGYPAWKAAFGPGVMGLEPYAPAATGSVIESGPDGDTITVASFQSLMKSAPGSVHLIDVRDPVEFDAGAMQGSVNIPIDELEDQVDELPGDKPILFICSTGARSGEAYDIVKLLREEAKVYFLDAEVTYDKAGAYTIVAN